MAQDDLIVRQLGVCDYEPIWHAMQNFTATRQSETADEIWMLQHRPIFTQGQAGKAEHLLNSGQIPVLQVDRGGQVTYHGPGQLMFYLLLDLRRRKLGVRQLVTLMEQSVIKLLAEYDITALARADAPGVYVDAAKVAALGLRVRHGRCYHGLSLNVDLDLSPFAGINPCGYQGLQVTRLRDLGVEDSLAEVRARLSEHLLMELGYNSPHFTTEFPNDYV
ncbi:MAG: lipoyl(octanoyl) transferase LipB [Gammaproteobacteria bacterium]|nr:lipoyl(octanoyl) transferase LipB [Gammaproteobacteria bacterium]